MKDIIIFDGQVFQTDAWHRGMGKYSLSLLQSMINDAAMTGTETYIVINSNLNFSDEANTALKIFHPHLKQIHLDLNVPKTYELSEYELNRGVNTSVLDDFVNKIVSPSIHVRYVILSLFIDQACIVFPKLTENVLIFYDIIPYLYPDYYGGEFPTYELYLARFRTILAADKIMTISQSVADDLVECMGIPAKRIRNINGGSIERSHIKPVKPKFFSVPENFMLMPTGDDIRKNNKRAVEGFEKYRLSSNNYDTYLIITSFFNQSTIDDLKTYSDHLIFTGNILEEELIWLYQNTQLLLFISECEGLGLPILEAVASNKPVVCSQIKAFHEISMDSFYYVNYLDTDSIADGIASAVGKYEWSRKELAYELISKKYQWRTTGKNAAAFLMKPITVDKAIKPKLAIVGPDPRGYSAVGKVIEQLHPSLSEYFDIDYYVEEQTSGHIVLRHSYLSYIASRYSVYEFNSASYIKYDHVLYHIGNSEYHVETIKRSLYLPGFAIMHDTKLDTIFSYMKDKGDISQDRYDAESRLDELFQAEDSTKAISIVSNQLGILVHSHFAEKSIRSTNIEKLNITRINLPIGVGLENIQKLSSNIVIGLAGIIHPDKGFDIIFELASDPDFKDVKFEIFGMAMISQADVDRLSLISNINVSSNLSDQAFQEKMSQLHMLINYRKSYKGEASLSVIEAMRFGVIPIVRDIGWYSELPNEFVKKLKSSAEIKNVLIDLIANPQEVKRLSEKVKEYAKKTFTYDQYSQGIYSFLSNQKLMNKNMVNTTTNKIKDNVKNVAKFSKSKK